MSLTGLVAIVDIAYYILHLLLFLYPLIHVLHKHFVRSAQDIHTNLCPIYTETRLTTTPSLLF